jgi:hypothetical protein
VGGWAGCFLVGISMSPTVAAMRVVHEHPGGTE